VQELGGLVSENKSPPQPFTQRNPTGAMRRSSLESGEMLRKCMFMLATKDTLRGFLFPKDEKRAWA
jgi:hypothetical protein